jgi:hypothetical protein
MCYVWTIFFRFRCGLLPYLVCAGLSSEIFVFRVRSRRRSEPWSVRSSPEAVFSSDRFFVFRFISVAQPRFSSDSCSSLSFSPAPVWIFSFVRLLLVWFSGRQLAPKTSFFPPCAARACSFGFSFCSCSLIQRRLSTVNHVSLLPVCLLLFSFFYAELFFLQASVLQSGFFPLMSRAQVWFLATLGSPARLYVCVLDLQPEFVPGFEFLSTAGRLHLYVHRFML